MDLVAEARRLREAGGSIKEIAHALNQDFKWVYKAVDGIPFSKTAWRDRARALKEAGKTIQEIAEIVHRSRGAVYSAVQIAKREKRPPKEKPAAVERVRAKTEKAEKVFKMPLDHLARMRLIASALARDTRIPPPITLPRVSILEKPIDL